MKKSSGGTRTSIATSRSEAEKGSLMHDYGKYISAQHEFQAKTGFENLTAMFKAGFTSKEEAEKAHAGSSGANHPGHDQHAAAVSGHEKATGGDDQPRDDHGRFAGK